MKERVYFCFFLYPEEEHPPGTAYSCGLSGGKGDLSRTVFIGSWNTSF